MERQKWRDERREEGRAARVKYSHQSTLSHLPVSNSYRVWSQLSGPERDTQLILIKRFTDLNTCLRRGEERRGELKKATRGESRGAEKRADMRKGKTKKRSREKEEGQGGRNKNKP